MDQATIGGNFIAIDLGFFEIVHYPVESRVDMLVEMKFEAEGIFPYLLTEGGAPAAMAGVVDIGIAQLEQRLDAHMFFRITQGDEIADTTVGAPQVQGTEILRNIGAGLFAVKAQPQEFPFDAQIVLPVTCRHVNPDLASFGVVFVAGYAVGGGAAENVVHASPHRIEHAKLGAVVTKRSIVEHHRGMDIDILFFAGQRIDGRGHHVHEIVIDIEIVHAVAVVHSDRIAEVFTEIAERQER